MHTVTTETPHQVSHIKSQRKAIDAWTWAEAYGEQTVNDHAV